MKESFMRRAKVLGVGTLFAVGLTTSASALNYKIGDVDLRVDINTSAGVSVRVADRNDKLLPTVNGGQQTAGPFFNMVQVWPMAQWLLEPPASVCRAVVWITG